jgi:hypothetical protein
MIATPGDEGHGATSAGNAEMTGEAGRLTAVPYGVGPQSFWLISA